MSTIFFSHFIVEHCLFYISLDLFFFIVCLFVCLLNTLHANWRHCGEKSYETIRYRFFSLLFSIWYCNTKQLLLNAIHCVVSTFAHQKNGKKIKMSVTLVRLSFLRRFGAKRRLFSTNYLLVSKRWPNSLCFIFNRLQYFLSAQPNAENWKVFVKIYALGLHFSHFM